MVATLPGPERTPTAPAMRRAGLRRRRASPPRACLVICSGSDNAIIGTGSPLFRLEAVPPRFHIRPVFGGYRLQFWLIAHTPLPVSQKGSFLKLPADTPKSLRKPAISCYKTHT